MKIHELHSPSRRFLLSTQLERDFCDSHALEGYILTPEINTSLARLTRGFSPTSGQRAWRITGDYGSGKSSFALLLANLASREANELPKHLVHLARDHHLSGKSQRLLPVLVTGAREPMGLALLRALNNALDLHVDRRLGLRMHAEICNALKNPKQLEESSIIRWVEATARELHENKIYRGVLIILDELGKFLEFAALHPERQDVYFLQKLAEASAHNGESCLFTVGLLHQGFGAYADKLSDTAQREWEKIAGRFEELVFSQPLGQVATLIASALELKSDTSVLRGWKKHAQDAMAQAVSLGLFGSAAPKTALINHAPDLYPLHATVVPVLTRFFRRFGQNERSLFSFLFSSEPYALQSFSIQEASPETIYRLSNFYDFIAHNFGHRLSTQSYRSHWNHIDGVIRSYPEDKIDELRVLKTIGILNTIEAAEFQPTAEVLSLALDDIKDLGAILKRLAQRGLLYLRGRSGGYALWPHTSVNLEQAFMHATEVVTSVPSIADSIRTRLETRPIVASRHYIETGNLRHFEVVYTGTEQLDSDRTLLTPRFPADGRLIIVLCENKEAQHRAERIGAVIKDYNATLIGITEPLERLSNLILELERWLWVEQNTVELKDDRYAAEEVSRQIAVSTQQLERALARDVGLHSAVEVNGSTIRWLYMGVHQPTLSSRDILQGFLSDICNKLFDRAPRVHNELINRHEVSSAAAAARQKLFGLMLKHRSDPELGLSVTKAPPEKSMYLSVLRASGIHRCVGESWDIQFPSPFEDVKIQILPALKHIILMLERKPDARINVGSIRDELRSAPFGVRDGLTPILLLTVLLQHETEIAVYEDGRFIPEVEENLLMRLVKQPQTFEFQLTRITGVRRLLIEKFARILAAHSADRIELISIVRPLCASIASLPEYVRLTDRLSQPTRNLRLEILKSQEPADLVFNSIPRALGFTGGATQNDVAAITQALSSALAELRGAYIELHGRMIKTTLSAFGVEDCSLQDWRKAICHRAETVILNITEPEFRAFVMKLTQDTMQEGEWLEALGSMIVRRPPSKWRDQDEVTFNQKIADLAQHYLRVESTQIGLIAVSAGDAVRISLTRITGEEANQVVTLSSKQNREAETVRNVLVNQLPKDKSVALAALSEIMWSLMKDKS